MRDSTEKLMEALLRLSYIVEANGEKRGDIELRLPIKTWFSLRSSINGDFGLIASIYDDPDSFMLAGVKVCLLRPSANPEPRYYMGIEL